MAADQRSVSVGGASSLEQYRMKKRKLDLPQNGLNSKSYISLKWDQSKKKVLAKQEQIGISRRNLKPFTDSVLGHLADAFSVPQETFELENLAEVLSYEVWQTQLSEEERNYLIQFLPRGQNTEQVVEALLAGDNFHFGNPFLKWGASICSCNLHPDAVLHKERSLKADKKAYYLELQKYHNDIIEYLLKLKERWGSCKDPEKEILPKIWRPRRDVEKRISSNAYESGLLDIEQDVTATSESCSWVADEKACSRDNLYSVMKGGELQKRNYEKGFMMDKLRNSLIASEDALNVGEKSKKGYKLNNRNIYHNDGAQYMSYVKISMKQHELVKNMQQSGKSIQSRSLNHVLGDFESLHVQPYEVFVEEEQKKKLHEHWFQLVTEDLPAFYVNWKERKKQLSEVMRSLMQEMKDKVECQIEDEEKENSGVQDEEKENSDVQEEEENTSVQGEDEESTGVQDEEEENTGVQGEDEESTGVQDEEEENTGVQDEDEESTGVQNEEEEYTDVQDEEEERTGVQDGEEENSESQTQDQKGNLATNHESNINDDEESAQGSPWNQSSEQITSLNGCHELNLATNHTSNINDDEVSAQGSRWNQSPEQIASLSGSSLSGSREFHIDGDPEKNHVDCKSNNSSADVRRDSEKTNTADDTVNQEVPASSSGDVWQAISRPHSYYDCTASHEFTICRLPLLNTQVNQDQQTNLIDLESDLHEEGMRKDLLLRQADDGSLSYQNQDRNEFLQSLFKGREMLSYHQEQKQRGIHFQPPNNSTMADQFPGHFQEHLETLLPLEQGQKRLNELFMQQNISDNSYSERGRYLIPGQENLQLGNMHNWNVNPVRISEPLDFHLNGGQLFSQNWFSGEHQVRGGWTHSGGVGIQSQSIENGSNADQSLFSVLPNCTQLRSVNPYDSVGTNDQFISSRNYGLMAGGGAPGISNTLPNSAYPLDYLGGRDSVISDDMVWMNLPHQNPALQHDPMGKPYLRSWNQ